PDRRRGRAAGARQGDGPDARRAVPVVLGVHRGVGAGPRPVVPPQVREGPGSRPADRPVERRPPHARLGHRLGRRLRRAAAPPPRPGGGAPTPPAPAPLNTMGAGGVWGPAAARPPLRPPPPPPRPKAAPKSKLLLAGLATFGLVAVLGLVVYVLIIDGGPSDTGRHGQASDTGGTGGGGGGGGGTGGGGGKGGDKKRTRGEEARGPPRRPARDPA